MTYFRINIDAESYRRENPGRPDQDVIDHWVINGLAYSTPRPDTNDHHAIYSRVRPGDMLFAYQSEVGIVALGEAHKSWDGLSHMGEHGLYGETAVVYRVPVDWRPLNPPIPFADIRAAGLGSVVGTFAEISSPEVGDALRRFCEASGRTTSTPATMEKSMPTSTSNFTTPQLNQILYGPPGTGKTYATVEATLEILDPAFLESIRGDRPSLKRRFDELVAGDDPVHAIRTGFPATMLMDASCYFDVPVSRIRSIVEVPRAASAGVGKRGVLDTAASERIWRLADIAAMARSVFERRSRQGLAAQREPCVSGGCADGLSGYRAWRAGCAPSA